MTNPPPAASKATQAQRELNGLDLLHLLGQAEGMMLVMASDDRQKEAVKIWAARRDRHIEYVYGDPNPIVAPPPPAPREKPCAHDWKRNPPLMGATTGSLWQCVECGKVVSEPPREETLRFGARITSDRHGGFNVWWEEHLNALRLGLVGEGQWRWGASKCWASKSEALDALNAAPPPPGYVEPQLATKGNPSKTDNAPDAGLPTTEEIIARGRAWQGGTAEFCLSLITEALALRTPPAPSPFVVKRPFLASTGNWEVTKDWENAIRAAGGTIK